MSGVDQSSSNDEKVKSFLALFGGRGDVFARRFDNAKTGKKGYSPYCENLWVHGSCGLMRGVRCADCSNRKLLPVSEEVVRWHLRGRDRRQRPFEMGAYPMTKDETVNFAVIDFDKSSWRRDALSVVGKVLELGLPVALEQSRSGKGAHIWFFFSESTSARMARAALSYILTLTLEAHPEISLDSYDRIIPNQATLPKGGFGSLVALPLQAVARKVGNSCFVNDDWVPYEDQWAFLSSIRRLTKAEVATIVERSKKENRSLVEVGSSARDEDKPWTFFLPLWSTLSPADRSASIAETPIEVVLMQSLFRKGFVDPRVKEYGQIIVDECHAVAAASFESIVDSAPCRYVLGLSATVMRNDGHDPLIMMQLGPIRHRVDSKTLSRREPFAHVVHVRQTSFRMKIAMPEDDEHFKYDVMLTCRFVPAGYAGT